jgi:cytoskeletal protein RodZ
MDVNKKEKSRLKRKSIISTSMGIALALIAIIMFVVFARSGVPEDMLGTGGGGQTMVQTTTTGTPTTTGKTTAPTTTETGKALNDLLSLSANVGSIKYDMSTSGTSIPTTTTTVWAKNNRKRMEMTQQGMNIVMLIDTSARTMYTFMPAQNLAMKIPFDSAQVPNSPADDTASIQDSNARIISTETIDGKVCAVVEFTSGQVSGRMWIWQEKGLPIRVEAGGITVEYKNLDFADIPDSMFELPAGVTIM